MVNLMTKEIPHRTPADLQRRDEVTKDLKDHVFMAHELPLRHEDAAAARIAAETAQIQAQNEARQPAQQQSPPAPQQTLQVPPQPKQKGDRIPRPVLEENINESDWGFFKSQWNMHVKGTGISGEAEIIHLWQSCSEPLQRSLHYAGAGSIITTEDLLNTIKQIAVKKRNNLVNFIELQKMGQFRDEPISAYSARLNGQANLCDFNVSFKEKSIMYQLIRGLMTVNRWNVSCSQLHK